MPTKQTEDKSMFGVAESVPKVRRAGRAPNPETIQIAQVALESIKDSKARFMAEIPDDKVLVQKTKQKIAAAEKYINKSRSDDNKVVLRSVYSPSEKRLYFAEESVLNALQK